MEEILRLMISYGERHNIEGGITLVLEEDGSGHAQKWLGDIRGNCECVFDFMNIDELTEKLNS